MSQNDLGILATFAAAFAVVALITAYFKRRHRAGMRAIAKESGATYVAKPRKDEVRRFSHFDLFERRDGWIGHMCYRFTNVYVAVFNFEYRAGDELATVPVVHIKSPELDLPSLYIWHNRGTPGEKRSVAVPGFPDFSFRYTIRTNDEPQALVALNRRVIECLESLDTGTMFEACGSDIILYQFGSILGVTPAMVPRGLKLGEDLFAAFASGGAGLAEQTAGRSASGQAEPEQASLPDAEPRTSARPTGAAASTKRQTLGVWFPLVSLVAIPLWGALCGIFGDWIAESLGAGWEFAAGGIAGFLAGCVGGPCGFIFLMWCLDQRPDPFAWRKGQLGGSQQAANAVRTTLSLIVVFLLVHFSMAMLALCAGIPTGFAGGFAFASANSVSPALLGIGLATFAAVGTGVAATSLGPPDDRRY